MEGWGGPREARKVITECRNRYLEAHPEATPSAVPS
jgi:hypothetical protein